MFGATFLPNPHVHSCVSEVGVYYVMEFNVDLARMPDVEGNVEEELEEAYYYSSISHGTSTSISLFYMRVPISYP